MLREKQTWATSYKICLSNSKKKKTKQVWRYAQNISNMRNEKKNVSVYIEKRKAKFMLKLYESMTDLYTDR